VQRGPTPRAICQSWEVAMKYLTEFIDQAAGDIVVNDVAAIA
jgi:hypothetical protein